MNYDDEHVKLDYNIPFEYIDTEVSAKSAAKELSGEIVLGVDIEATGLDQFVDIVLLVQIATVNKSFVIDARKVDLNIFKPILENKGILKILQNAKYDYKFLAARHNIRLNNIYDTFIAEKLLTAGRQKSGFSLEALAYKYLGVALDKKIRNEFIGKSDIEFSKKQLLYAANDAYILHEIYNQQTQILVRDNLVKVALLEFGTLPVVAEQELKGCAIDTTKWRGMLGIARKYCEEARKDVLRILAPVIPQKTLFGDVKLNLESPAQVLDAFHRLGLKVDDTDKNTIKNIEHPVIDPFIEYKKWEKIISTYGEKILSRIHKKTDRLHPEINQIEADTGRSSSRNPNSQNLPGYDSDDPKSLDLRSCFVASPGYKYVGADFSQQELRILAELSGDQTFIEAFKSGKDVHKQAAGAIYKKPLNRIKKIERLRAKTTMFTLVYGGTAYTISKRLDIPEEEAQKLIDDTFRAFTKIQQFMQRSYLSAINTGYSETIIGRRRYYDIPSKDSLDYKTYNRIMRSIKRKSCNHPVQGSAADVSKQSLINLWNLIEETKIDACPVLFIHDEIIVECKNEDVEQCKELLRRAMLDGYNAFFKKVPMVVDVWESDHWIKG